MSLPYISKLEFKAGIGSPCECTARIEKEALYISGMQKEYIFNYRQIDSFEGRNYRIYMTHKGFSYELSGLGYNYEDFLRELMAAYNEQLLKDLLMSENLCFEVRGEWGTTGEPSEAVFRLYENALVIIPWDHALIRVPFCFIKTIETSNYKIVIKDTLNNIYTIYRLGRQHDPFIREYEKCINKMIERCKETLIAICPEAPKEEINRVSLMMPDGIGIQAKVLSAVAPGVLAGFEQYLSNAGAAKEFEFFKGIAQHDEMFFGVKRGLMGDLTGELLWYMVPIYKSPDYIQSVAIEFIQDGKPSGATYFYKMENCNSGEDWLNFSNEINYALIGVNFRKEPIYISDETLNMPKNEGHKIAVNKLPSLQKLRRLFLGRAIHKDFDSWSRGVASIIKK